MLDNTFNWMAAALPGSEDAGGNCTPISPTSCGP